MMEAETGADPPVVPTPILLRIHEPTEIRIYCTISRVLVGDKQHVFNTLSDNFYDLRDFHSYFWFIECCKVRIGGFTNFHFKTESPEEEG